jgi:fimbrial chaperone protein
MTRRAPCAVFAAALCAAGLFLSAPASAGELEVSPVLVELNGSRRSAIVSIKNTAQASARYQVRAYAWGQDDQGTMQLAETKDVVVFPPLVELGSGEERKLRIGISAAPAATEKSYRVFVEELPPPESPDAPGQVRVLTRIGVPIFFAPTKALTKGEVGFLSAGAGRAEIRIRNTGTVRLRPAAVTLYGVAVDGTRTFVSELHPWYVLAAGERQYQAQIPADACARTRELRATVTVDPAPLEASLRLSDGACAR